MVLPFSIRVTELPLFGKELFIRLAVRVFTLCVLLSLLVLRVGCGM